jgi:3-hydroxyisobutyrate dehydrogenase-like beta-hydroxyacid dehydrogenase
MSELKIGFVGLGDQGAPMAARRPQSFDAISTVKYVRHDSFKSLAVMVDVLSLCLRDDADIWNLIRQHRLIETLRSGSIVVNHGTGDPTERACGLDPSSVRDRGLGGTDGVLEFARWTESSTTFSQ